MDIYKTEEEQVKAFKKWWHENGKSIIAGIVIGIAALLGWREYEHYAVLQAEAASTLYAQMLDAARDNDTENSSIYANRIIEDHKTGTYAVFASLMRAKIAAEAGDLEQAEAHLRWVLDNNSLAGLEHIARLRLVRVLIAGAKLELATTTLNARKPDEFIAQYEELRGDILVRQGKHEEARLAYKKSLANSSTATDTQSILQMKLDNLGRG